MPISSCRPFLFLPVFLLTLLTGSQSPASSISWTFATGNDGWGPYGTPKDLTPEERSLFFKSFVRWDEGHRVLKIEDPFRKEARPYATSPEVAIETDKHYVIDGALQTGNASNPIIWIAMMGDDGSLKGTEKARFDPPDINGWTPFRIELLPSMIKEGTRKARIGVRPPVDPDDPTKKAVVLLRNIAMRTLDHQSIDLRKQMNRGFRDEGKSKGWTGQGSNDLRDIRPGILRSGDLEFSIQDPAANQNRSVIALRDEGEPGFTSKTEIPLGGNRYERLQLLNTGAWARSGVIGTVEFQYENGQSASCPLNIGSEIGDWWAGNATNASIVPLEDAAPMQKRVYLFVSTIENPHPQEAIRAVAFRAGQKTATWLILSAIGSNGPASKVDQAAANFNHSKVGWKEFATGLHPTRADAVSLEPLLDAPAGKHGFVKVKNGEFVFSDGTPARFWGVNFYPLFPTYEEADQIAATLARYGCNIVRLHFPSLSLLPGNRKHPGDFASPEQLDRFDYLVYTLKTRGIYIYMGSLAAADAVSYFKPDFGFELPLSHGAAYYDPKLREFSFAYMKNLLSHVNRYTGKRLPEDPVLAMVEVINESSIFWNWTYSAMRPKDAIDFQRLYNQWLLERYGSRDGLAKAWGLEDGSSALAQEEDPAQSTVLFPNQFRAGLTSFGKATQPGATPRERLRARTEVEFLQHIQSRYFRDIAGYAAELGVQVPICGTNIIYDLAELETMGEQGVSSQNIYWDHVQPLNKGGYRSHNIPEVTVDPLDGGEPVVPSTVWLPKMSGVANITTENDAMWPNEWRAAHFMMTGANAALGNAGGMFLFSFAGGAGLPWSRFAHSPSILRPCTTINDAVELASYTAGAFLYLRGDVTPAKNLVNFAVDDNLKLAAGGRLRDGSFPANYLSFVSRYEITFPGDKPTSKPVLTLNDRGDGTRNSNRRLAEELDAKLKKIGALDPAFGLQPGKIISDTGELTLDWKQQQFLVNTPRSQGVAGFFTEKPVALGDLVVRGKVPFAAIQVSSLDRQPLSKTRRMLVIAAARSGNRDEVQSYLSTKAMPSGALRGEDLFTHFTGIRPQDRNAGPAMIEPVKASLELPGNHFSLTALGPDMAPIEGSTREFEGNAGKTVIELGEGAISVWYLLERNH